MIPSVDDLAIFVQSKRLKVLAFIMSTYATSLMSSIMILAYRVKFALKPFNLLLPLQIE